MANLDEDAQVEDGTHLVDAERIAHLFDIVDACRGYGAKYKAIYNAVEAELTAINKSLEEANGANK